MRHVVYYPSACFSYKSIAEAISEEYRDSGIEYDGDPEKDLRSLHPKALKYLMATNLYELDRRKRKRDQAAETGGFPRVDNLLDTVYHPRRIARAKKARKAFNKLSKEEIRKAKALAKKLTLGGHLGHSGGSAFDPGRQSKSVSDEQEKNILELAGKDKGATRMSVRLYPYSVSDSGSRKAAAESMIADGRAVSSHMPHLMDESVLATVHPFTRGILYPEEKPETIIHELSHLRDVHVPHNKDLDPVEEEFRADRMLRSVARKCPDPASRQAMEDTATRGDNTYIDKYIQARTSSVIPPKRVLKTIRRIRKRHVR